MSPADLALASAQVENTEAQAINVGVARAQFEHAIAMLIGRPPANSPSRRGSCPAGSRKFRSSVPSTLLERRPDIAASERTMQEQNALIGVAEAAYFPDISLSSMIEYHRSDSAAVQRRAFDRQYRRERERKRCSMAA